MPKKIQKSLQDCLSKIKSSHPPQIQLPFNSLSSSKSWILSGCKHPRTPSFAIEDGRNEAHGGGSGSSSSNINHNDDAATLADVDRFLLENFKSLYLKDDFDEETTANTDSINITRRVCEEESHSHEEAAPKLGPILFDSPRFVEPPRDLVGSNRFLIKPGFSGSLVEDALTTSMTNTCDEIRSSSTSTTTTTTTLTLNDSSSSNLLDHIHVHNHHNNAKEAMDDDDHHQTLPDNCIALLTYSPSPYEDFRRSMQDVVDARLGNHQRVDWDFMEELLFCYLNLNEKKSHKFILSAFVDLVVDMRRRSETVLAKPRSVRTVRIAGSEVRKKKMKEVTLEFR